MVSFRVKEARRPELTDDGKGDEGNPCEIWLEVTLEGKDGSVETLDYCRP